MIDAIKKISLGEVATIAAGYPLRGSVDSLNQGEVSFVQMRNVNPTQGINWKSVTQVTLPTKRESDWLNEDDIVFAARGAKNYAVTVPPHPKRAVCSPHFFILRILDRKTILPDFLAWQINQKPAQDYFQRYATGSNILNINRSAIENLDIIIPSLYKQEAIVTLWNCALKERHILERFTENRNQLLEAIAVDLFNRTGEKSHE